MKINRYKRSSNTSYALGATLVLELIKTSPDLLKRVFISPDLDKSSQEAREILSFCTDQHIEMLESNKPFNVLSPKGNIFVIAEFEKRSARLDPNKDHIVLVNPSDAGNIGTIVRAAAGFGYEDIAIINPAVDAFNPKSIRASMGAVFHVRAHYYDDIEDYIKDFPDHHRYAFMLRGAIDFSGAEISSPFAFIFGTEASGLPESFADFCTPVKIPQSENIDSLSLPMAATLAMYAHRKI